MIGAWLRQFAARVREALAGRRRLVLPSPTPKRDQAENARPEVDVCWPHRFETKVQPSSPNGPEERFRVCSVCGAEDDGDGGPTEDEQRAQARPSPVREERRETRPTVERDWHGEPIGPTKEEG